MEACEGNPLTSACSAALLEIYGNKMTLTGEILDKKIEKQTEEEEDSKGSLLQADSGFFGFIAMHMRMIMLFVVRPVLLITLPIWLPGFLCLIVFQAIVSLIERLTGAALSGGAFRPARTPDSGCLGCLA